MNLSSNKMLCDCYTSQLKQKLISKEVMSGVIYEDFTCHSNAAFLSETPYSALSCPFPYWYGQTKSQCPSFCTCKYNTHFQQVNIDCKNKSLHTIPNLDQLKMENLAKVVLDLSHNKLTTLVRRVAEENHKVIWDKIVYLDISHNLIKMLNPHLLPRSLKNLKINDNKISEFSHSELSYFKDLHESGNSYNCSACFGNLLWLQF